MPRVNPYEVEPEYTEEELREIENQQRNDMFKNEQIQINLEGIRNNCACGNCVPEWLGLNSDDEKIQNMKRYLNWKDVRTGFICCKQIDKVIEYLNDADEPTQCVTNDIDYKFMCQRKRALQATYRSYLHARQRPLPEKFTNRTYRYTAYRTYTHLIFQKLGRGIRRAVPLCTILDIIKNFPEDDVNAYTSYEPGVEIERFRAN